MTRLTGMLLAAALLGAAAGAEAQVVRGLLLAEADVRPIADAVVLLIDGDGAERARAVTDSAGWFLLASEEAGWYRLRSSPLGFRAATTPRIEVQVGVVIDVRFLLSTEAVLLAPLEVTARARPVAAGGALAAYRDRVRRGVGYQLTRDHIAQQNPRAMSDLLRRVPGVHVERTGLGTTTITMTAVRRIERSCPVRVYVDGLEFRHGATAVDDVVPVDIEGIEVFRNLAEVPPEFAGPDAQCGVISIWTRRGR